MNKTTLKGLLALLCVFAMLNTYAQSKEATKESVMATTSQGSNAPAVSPVFQLNAESQRSLQETGYAKCVSEEMHARRMQRNPNLQSDQDFEEWLAPLMEARKKEIAAQKANGTFKKALIQVPIIFHVITSGSGQTNLSAALINAQIDQLNYDLNNQGGVNQTASGHAAAADAEIEFIPALVDPLGATLAEPGINRITTYGAGPFPTTDFDVGDGGLEIKSTSWDYNLYANVWTADITGGILGYAQFPSNSTLPGLNTNGGASVNSGVVCGYGTIGGRDLPGSAAPYNLGRTLTHEIGHWIGLRHIWGDGNCNADDFVTDTPNAGGANYGCPTGTNSCNGGANPGDDMIENYMDYTDDACMDIFTAGQVLRIETVFANSDGLSNLPSSTTGQAAAPFISFSATSSSITEGSDCAFTDITIPLTIGLGPTATAVATFTVNGSTTGTNGVDFALQTPSLSFAQSATVSQDMVLRVFNDSFVEGDETVTIDFTVNPNGGDAVAGANTSFTLTIVEDDTVVNALTTVEFINEDFETVPTGWTTLDEDGDGNNWVIGAVPGTVVTTDQLYSRSWLSTATPAALTPDNYIITSQVTLPAALTSANLSYQVAPSTLTSAWYLEYYTVYWATDISSAATISASPQVKPGGTIAQAVVNESLDMSAYAGQTGYLVFRHHNCTDQEYITIDNMLLTGQIASSVQTAVNTAVSNDQLSLAGAGTVYTNDAVSGDVMLDVTNNNTFDYGCTDISVSRAGASAQAYNGSTSPNFVMDKVFTVSPTNVASGGNTTVTFYFEEAEVLGWETATGLSRNVLEASREGSADLVPLAVGAFGAHVTLTGTFTGLTGDFYFGPNAAFAGAGNILVSPKVYLSGAALNSGSAFMRDDLRVAGIIPTTSPYDAATCNATVFNTTGANAIVDWVWVELRDQTNSAVVVEGQSALLQADGDIVDVDGTSALGYAQAGDRYFIAVDHRNHLAIMSDTAILLSSSSTAVDFSNAASQITIGANAQTSTGMPAGVVAMWAGDTNANDSVSYQGAGNDTNTVKDNVIAQPANTTASNLYSFSAYDAADVNMDGNISYQGAGNDSNVIKDNILAHPGNATGSNLFSFVKQF